MRSLKIRFPGAGAKKYKGNAAFHECLVIPNAIFPFFIGWEQGFLEKILCRKFHIDQFVLSPVLVKNSIVNRKFVPAFDAKLVLFSLLY